MRVVITMTTQIGCVFRVETGRKTVDRTQHKTLQNHHNIKIVPPSHVYRLRYVFPWKKRWIPYIAGKPPRQPNISCRLKSRAHSASIPQSNEGVRGNSQHWKKTPPQNIGTWFFWSRMVHSTTSSQTSWKWFFTYSTKASLPWHLR